MIKSLICSIWFRWFLHLTSAKEYLHLQVTNRKLHYCDLWTNLHICLQNTLYCFKNFLEHSQKWIALMSGSGSNHDLWKAQLQPTVHTYQYFFSINLRWFITVCYKQIKPIIACVQHNLYFSHTEPSYMYTFQLPKSHNQAVFKIYILIHSLVMVYWKPKHVHIAGFLYHKMQVVFDVYNSFFHCIFSSLYLLHIIDHISKL